MLSWWHLKSNEAFHHCTWERVPKERFCGIDRPSLGVQVATASFKDGEKGVVAVFKAVCLLVIRHHWQYAIQADSNRVRKANTAVTEKQQRLRHRQSVDKAFYNAGSECCLFTNFACSFCQVANLSYFVVSVEQYLDLHLS